MRWGSAILACITLMQTKRLFLELQLLLTVGGKAKEISLYKQEREQRISELYSGWLRIGFVGQHTCANRSFSKRKNWLLPSGLWLPEDAYAEILP